MQRANLMCGCRIVWGIGCFLALAFPLDICFEKSHNRRKSSLNPFASLISSSMSLAFL